MYGRLASGSDTHKTLEGNREGDPIGPDGPRPALTDGHPDGKKAPSRLGTTDQSPCRARTSDLVVSGLEEFPELHPVDVGCIESNSKPTPIAMMRRWGEPTVLLQRSEFEGVGEKVK